MRRLSVLVGFVTGCIIIVAIFTIGFNEVVMVTMVGALLAMVLFLAVMGILSKGKDKWRVLALDGVLLLGFGVLIFDVVMAPLGLFLLIFSLLQLKRVQAKRRTS
ncbi:MAG: hypothetical protein ACYSTI_11065 [Planctomycetota bacterium]